MGVNVQIENRMVHFRERALPRCRSFDNVNHTPDGGDKKVLLITRCSSFVTVSEVS